MDTGSPPTCRTTTVPAFSRAHYRKGSIIDALRRFVHFQYRTLIGLKGTTRRFARIIIVSALIIPCLPSLFMLPEARRAFAQSEPISSIQLDALCHHLGIEPADAAVLGAPPPFFAASVQDPQPLFSMGLYGVQAGDRVNLVNLGPDHWRVKHYATGHSIEIRLGSPQ